MFIATLLLQRSINYHKDQWGGVGGNFSLSPCGSLRGKERSLKWSNDISAVLNRCLKFSPQCSTDSALSDTNGPNMNGAVADAKGGGFQGIDAPADS